jgi:hypothetical protein
LALNGATSIFEGGEKGTQKYGAGVLKAKKEATGHSFGEDAAFVSTFNSSVLPRRTTLSSLPLKASHPSLLSVVHSQHKSVSEREREREESRDERDGAQRVSLFFVCSCCSRAYFCFDIAPDPFPYTYIHTYIHTDARPLLLLLLSRASAVDLLVRFFL